MTQIFRSSQSITFTVFRFVLIAEIIVFLFAAIIHTGVFGLMPIEDASIVESLCAVACMVSAFALFTGKRWALTAAVIAQVFILLGVLLGVAALTYFSFLLTPINIGFHGIMLMLIITELVLLTIPGTRAAFSKSG